MRATVRISFGPTEIIASLPQTSRPWSADEGRRWLDEKFSAYECEPLRAMGKVLVVDKLVVLAHAIGPQAFSTDEALRQDFASAAAAVLASPQAHIDVDARRVSF